MLQPYWRDRAGNESAVRGLLTLEAARAHPEWQQYLRTRTPPALIDAFLDSHVIAPAPV
jgi:hypothetical protein